MTWKVLALLAITAGAGSLAGQQQTADERGIRAAVEHYFQGHATGDGAHFRLAFLPTAHIEGIRANGFTSWDLEAYAGNFNGKPAADEASRRRTIDVIDVTGTAAMVKATLQHGSTTFTDYFVMLKVDGAWKIANKVYHAERR